MFKAILNGKVRNNIWGSQLDTHWRQLYRQTEDFLTAAVFTRLSYLPSDLLWRLIRSTTVVDHAPLPVDEDRPLVAVEFWPNKWSLKVGDEQKRVEPDVFMDFRDLYLIIEAKLGGGQDPAQWAREIAACLQREEQDITVPIWLLAIGGLEEPIASNMRSLRRQAETKLQQIYGNYPVRVAACSWQQLLKALIALARQIGPERDHHFGHLIRDLVEILRFHGFRDTHWLEELGRADARIPGDIAHTSIDAIGHLIQKVSAVPASRHWYNAPGLTQIDNRSIQMLGRLL